MKLILRTLLLLFVLSFAGATFAQSTAKPAKAPKAAKASKHKASKAGAVAPAVPGTAAEAAAAGKPFTPTTPAPATSPTPANSPTLTVNPDRTITDPVSAPVVTPTPELAPGMVIDPVTGQAVPEKLTTIKFEEVSFDFGKIDQGDVVKHKFKFTNTGENPLILENVKPSCGCTALDWPKDPIAPGKSGEIEAQFNSTGKSGPQMKNITITLNSVERLERLSFTGEVIVKPTEGGTTPAPQGSGH